MTTQPADTLTTPRLGRYEIDTVGSTVRFRTRHLFGLAPVRGEFAIRTGTVDVTEPLADSRISVQIDAASFRTGNRQRDNNVRSALFLDTGRYPVMTFVSDRIEGTAVTGNLTVRDVTRPARLSIEASAVSTREFTARVMARIDRTDFGVTASRGLAGRYLELTMEIQCVRR
jgi:polyisoprenoid-binding protein YceI